MFLTITFQIIYHLQITTFLTIQLTVKFTIKVLSCVLFFTILLINYSSFHINIKTVS